jgi:hypothetical protein
MDSAALSLTCAGLGGAEEDDDGAVVGYAKGEHCLGIYRLRASSRKLLWFRLHFGSATQWSLNLCLRVFFLILLQII